MKPIVPCLVACVFFFSIGYAQTPKYSIGSGEYQNFILDNTSHTLYGLGTGGNGIGTNTGQYGLPIPCQFPTANTQIKYVASSLHTGACVDMSGNVYFTGPNEDGTMGNGTTTGFPTSFVQIPTDSLGNTFTGVNYLAMASSIFTGGAAYGAIIYAVKDDGTLWVWGNTQGGYRGNGSYGMVNTKPVQVMFPAGTFITKVLVQNIVIALDSAGNVWTWAGNGPNDCLLGSTTRTDYMTPEKLALPGPAKDIAGGGLYSYALLRTGNLYGWGLYLGYLGVGSTAGSGWTNQPAPLLLDNQLNLPAAISKISCNQTTTYVILSDGSLWSWGGNECGQVGEGTELNYMIYTVNPAPYGGTTPEPYAWNWDLSTAQLQQHKPIQVAPGINNFVGLSEGVQAVFYKFAVDANGQLYSMGRNKYGVLANGVIDANYVDGSIGATYPNSWDVPYITAINPFTSGLKTIQSTSPYCIANPNATSCPTYTIPANTAPSVNPGPNQTVTGTTANLDGSGSTDNVAIVYYVWTQVSGPSTALIVIPSGAKAQVRNLVTGVYKFQLRCTDNGWMSDSSTVTITVNGGGPTANAGSNKTITLPANSVILSGSGTESGSGTITGYGWTQVSGPSTANIGNVSQASTAVSGLVQGTYTFQLTVTNNSGVTGTATVTVTVSPAPVVVPGPPSADAGSDQTITLPTNSVTLTGSGSDSAGTITSYQWTEVSGPGTANFASGNQAQTAVSGLVQGAYTFQLTVTNNKGVTATSQIKITVNAAPVVPGLPSANAGSDQTITLPTNSVTLTGSGSETNGTIVSYVWAQQSGPSSATIATSGQASTAVSALVAGVYTFQLTVKDNSGVTATDVVKVTVNPAVVVPGSPIVDAGANQTITLPVSGTTLTATASETNGTIVSYGWTQISGPSPATIGTAGEASTAVSGLVQGVYAFQITVKDNSGVTATDVVKVTVNAASIIAGPPSANAGSNQVITLPVNSVTLLGSGSETNGTIVSYAWTEVSGPSTAAYGDPNQAVTVVSGLVQGDYTFQITVTDNSGVTATAQMKVTVNPAPAIIPPVAIAGPNQTDQQSALPVELNGSASYDSGGTIVSYQWVQVAGQGGVTIANSGSATPQIYGMSQGTYVFQLTVTNNQGATATAEVTITMTAAAAVPVTLVANAGADTTIGYPGSTAVLNGSGSSVTGSSIVAYSWAQTSGPTTAAIADPSSSVTNISQLQPGSYTFELTVADSSGGTDTSSVEVSVISELRTSEGQTLSIYPNPFMGASVTLSGSNNWTGKVSVQLLTLDGKRLMEYEFNKGLPQFTQEIPLPSGLMSGVYLLSVYFEGQQGRPTTYRIVKQ